MTAPSSPEEREALVRSLRSGEIAVFDDDLQAAVVVSMNEDDWRDLASKAATAITEQAAEIARLKPWSIALQSVTAGGSEFQDPAGCVAYVRMVRDTQRKVICRFKEERDDARADRAALQARVAELEAKSAGATEAFAALNVADRLIELGYGMDTPPEWNKAFRRVVKARSRVAPPAIRALPINDEEGAS